jgi:hypothetical protein
MHVAQVTHEHEQDHDDEAAKVNARRTTATRPAIAALLLACAVGMPTGASAQDTTGRTATASATSRMAARLRLVFRPPERGTTRERSLGRGADPTRALVPELRIDTLVPQTLRSMPFVAVCVAGQPDSARLTLRLRDTTATTTIALTAGLNRIALSTTGLLLRDGDVATWSLATRSGVTYLESQIERRVVRATPTAASLTRNGIWSDALDLMVVDALERRPLAAERLTEFLGGVGLESCPVPPPE